MTVERTYEPNVRGLFPLVGRRGGYALACI